MELDRIKYLRNEMWIYTNIGAIATVEIDEVLFLFLFLFITRSKSKS